MNVVSRYMIQTIAFVLIVSITIVSSTSGDQTTIRTVRIGDTVSLMSIKIYGFYNEEIELLVKEANTNIKDLNRIHIGQQINFPPYSDAKNKPYCVKTSASNAVVTYLEGKVGYSIQNNDEWMDLRVNTILHPGTILKTGSNARVELVVNNTDVMRLSANTELVIEELAEKPEVPKAKFKFSMGKIWTKVKSYIERSGAFELGFPTAIAAVQGTIYQAELNPDSTACIKVYRGAVKVSEVKTGSNKSPVPKGQLAPPGQVSGPRQVSMNEWVKIVRKMQSITFGPGETPSEPEDFTERWTGDWEKFNRSRDELFDKF
jgi:hypothetical protein